MRVYCGGSVMVKRKLDSYDSSHEFKEVNGCSVLEMCWDEVAPSISLGCESP